MTRRLERVNALDDPRRCHGATRIGQCMHVAVDGGHHCPNCARIDLTEAGRRQYLLTNPRFQEKLEKFSTADEIKSLTEEVAIARMLVEERLNKIDTDADLYASCGAINTLLLTIEKLVSRSHILEQNLGQLFHRSTIVQMMQAFVAVVDDEVRPLEGGVPAIDRIVKRLYDLACDARNEQKARGMKLLKDDI